jgi:hypothetical protein
MTGAYHNCKSFSVFPAFGWNAFTYGLTPVVLSVKFDRFSSKIKTQIGREHERSKSIEEFTERGSGGLL